MNALQSGGAYTVDAATADAVRALFYGGCCDDKETVEVIRNTFEKDGYLCDTHTAVAVGVYEQYLKETGDNTPAVIASTASPYKFPDSVLDAFDCEKPAGSVCGGRAAREAFKHKDSCANHSVKDEARPL